MTDVVFKEKEAHDQCTLALFTAHTQSHAQMTKAFGAIISCKKFFMSICQCAQIRTKYKKKRMLFVK